MYMTRGKLWDVLNEITAVRRVGWRSKKLIGEQSHGSKPAKTCSHFWKHVKTESTSPWLSRKHSCTPEATTSCLHMNSLVYCPQPIQSSKHVFLTDHEPIPELPFSRPLYLQPMQILSKQGTSFFPKLIHKRAPSAPEQWMCLSSSSITGGLDRMSQDLVLFLVSIWLNKSCLLGELLASKVFCCLRGNILWLSNMIQSGNSTYPIQRRYSIWDRNLGSGTKIPSSYYFLYFSKPLSSFINPHMMYQSCS